MTEVRWWTCTRVTEVRLRHEIFLCLQHVDVYCMDVKPTQFDALFIYVQHSFVILLDVNARSSMLGEDLMDCTGRYCRLIYVYLLCHIMLYVSRIAMVYTQT